MPAPKSLDDQFWSRVDKTPGHGPDGECWLWTGCTNKNPATGKGGYGRIGRGGGNRKISVHRLSWEIHFGPISDGQNVLHKCDVRLCVRPGHLFLGTINDNNQDMHEKGRYSKGESHGHAKLTEEDVKSIRHLYFAERKSQYELAEYFRVSQTSVSKIVRRKNWAWL